MLTDILFRVIRPVLFFIKRVLFRTNTTNATATGHSGDGAQQHLVKPFLQMVSEGSAKNLPSCSRIFKLTCVRVSAVAKHIG